MFHVLAVRAGLEPAAIALTARRSTVELPDKKLAGAPGIEPGQPASEAGVLPLNYTPCMALPLRFERSSPALHAGAITRLAREALVLGDGIEPSAISL